MEACNGCGQDAKRKRAWWDVCDKCVKEFDALKHDAKSALTLKTFSDGAHRWRITGAIDGDVSSSDMGEFAPFKIHRPIIVEDGCQHCAIHKALMSIDPWAFNLTLAHHGEMEEHDGKDIRDYLMWSHQGEDKQTLFVEDLGEIGADVWNRRNDVPTLFSSRKKVAAR